jgi:hypothetical protein
MKYGSSIISTANSVMMPFKCCMSFSKLILISQKNSKLITNQSLKFDSPVEIVFPDKSILKKTQDEVSEELNILLAKEAESNLTSSEKEFLESQLIDHPHLRKHQQAMKRARLTSSKIILEDKSPIRFSEWPAGLEDELLIISILEGDASPEDVKKFELRLTTEPALKKVYERFLSIKLSSNHVAFPQKGELIFPDAPDLSNKEMLLAAYAEGDLTGIEKNAAMALISAEPETARQYETLQGLRLSSPTHITFPYKSSLYQKAAVVIPLKRYFAYASGVAAAIAAIMWFSHQKTGTEQGFAETSHPQPAEVHAPLNSSTDTVVNSSGVNSAVSTQGKNVNGDSDLANRPEAVKNAVQEPKGVVAPIAPFEAAKAGKWLKTVLHYHNDFKVKKGFCPRIKTCRCWHLMLQIWSWFIPQQPNPLIPQQVVTRTSSLYWVEPPRISLKTPMRTRWQHVK